MEGILVFMSELQRVVVSGSYYEIGFHHGREAAQKIRGTLQYYQTKLCAGWEMDWMKVRNLAQEFYFEIERYFPEMIEELKGVAEGAGLDFEDILAINAHYELGRKAQAETGGCSVIAITGSASNTGRTLMAENWDYGLGQQDNVIVLEITEPTGLKICMVTEAGIIGRMGMNSSGLGLCGNTLKNDFTDSFIPVHLMKRLILRQTKLEDAIRIVQTYKTASSYNFLIGSRDGTTADIESDPVVQKVNRTDGGWICHTNHFTCPELRRYRDYTKYEKQDSLERLRIMQEFLNKKTVIGIEDIRELLKNHDGYPDSICRHPNDSQPTKMRSATLISIIMDLNKLSIDVAWGRPCETPYVPYYW